MYEKWSEEEIIWGYLLSRAPMNKNYPQRNDGKLVYKWGKYNYEKVALELSLAKQIGQINTQERDASKVDSIQNAKRAHMKDLSDKIKSCKITREPVSVIS